MKYKQLTLEERYHISALKKQEYKQFEIAKAVGVHPSTISRELRDNLFDKQHNPLTAQSESYLGKNHKGALTPIRFKRQAINYLFFLQDTININFRFIRMKNISS